MKRIATSTSKRHLPIRVAFEAFWLLGASWARRENGCFCVGFRAEGGNKPCRLRLLERVDDGR
jgi:hypothetical protein